MLTNNTLVVLFMVLYSAVMVIDSSSLSYVRRITPVPKCGELGNATHSTRLTMKQFLNPSEIDFLLDLVYRGMSSIPENHGPTIMDPDLGLVLGPGGNVKRITERFSQAELVKYGELMKRLQRFIMKTHSLTFLHHTAPTFFARLLAPSQAKSTHIHDEYWHEHCDKNNTAHYDYSALVYLSTYEKDFTGGQFVFSDHKSNPLLPEAGMLVTFASGVENPHRVHKVKSGKRIAWSTWWTCDPSHKLKNSQLLGLHDEL